MPNRKLKAVKGGRGNPEREKRRNRGAVSVSYEKIREQTTLNLKALCVNHY